jgi:uncharacterized protein
MKKDSTETISFSMRMKQKICDPIHGFIRITECEEKLIYTLPFQRLHQISQLGLTYYVYPGARHTRFEHSLGVMELTSKLFCSIFNDSSLLPGEFDYWHQVVRLAALCHDLGHLPFSHTAEEVLLGKKGHEKMSAKILLSPLMDGVWELLPNEMQQDVLDLSLSPEVSSQYGALTPWKKLLSQLISDDNFGADRIDYLLRDGYYTGVHFGTFDYQQLMDQLTYTNDPHPQLALYSDGIQAVEALWIARYLMYSRLYFHPKVRIYGLQMTHFMESYYQECGVPSEIEDYLLQTDATLMEALKKRRVQDQLSSALFYGKLLYQELPLEGKRISPDYLERLTQEFPRKVFVDRLFSQPQTRTFPVITTNGEIVSSTHLSDFLEKIPFGSQTVRVYYHPDVAEKVIFPTEI